MNRKRLPYVKFLIDLIMAVTFVLLFNKRVLGGLPFHEIAGLVIAAIFFTHVLLNRRWVKNITLKLFKRKLLPGKTRLGYVLNLILLLSISFIIISGIFISKVVFPTIDISNRHWFKITHISVSYLTLIIVALHIGLHWKWVSRCVKNLLKFKSKKRFFHIFAKAAVISLFVFGLYQMVSSHFFTHLQGVTAIFNPPYAADLGKGGSWSGDGANIESEKRRAVSEEFNGSQRKVKKHSFSETEDDSGFKGRESHSGSPHPLEIITSYFSIMAVFIIAVYYLEEFFKRKKKHKSHPDVTSG